MKGCSRSRWYPQTARGREHSPVPPARTRSSWMLDRRWRAGVERGLGPLGRGLRGLGVPADALTVFGLLASVATALLIASGHLVWAVVGVIVAGVSDLLDGAIARGSGSASPRGAFFD